MNLETERLLLRPLTMDDLDVYAELYADPEVTRYLGSGQTMTRRQTEAQLRDLIQREERDGFGLRSVVRKEDGRLLGRCGLHRWEIDGVEELEVGWVFGKEFWGHGYATEAALAVRDHAVAELGHTRLIALIKRENGRSQKVAGKLGMAYERDVELASGPAQLYALTMGPAR